MFGVVLVSKENEDEAAPLVAKKRSETVVIVLVLRPEIYSVYVPAGRPSIRIASAFVGTLAAPVPLLAVANMPSFIGLEFV